MWQKLQDDSTMKMNVKAVAETLILLEVHHPWIQ